MRTSICLLFLSLTTLASGNEPSAGSPPNILFAIADDWGHAGAYGTPWMRTPNFDRLAEQGILFMKAYTPNSKCSPSRACILTGRNPWQNGAAGNHVPFYPPELKSWMEALSDAGYSIGSTGKVWGPGQLPEERKNLTGKNWNEHKVKTPATKMSSKDYAANFEDFLSTEAKDQPFCFWFGAHEPHRSYEYGSGVSKGGYKLTDIDQVPSYWPDTESVRHDMLDYAYEVAYFDQQLGRMVDHLKEKGLLENTIIVVTSDNGAPFPRMKGHPFEQAVHLPLAVMWPKGIVNPGRKSEALVSLIDLAPTFLELGGVDPAKSGMQSVTGRSLSDILKNTPEVGDRSTLLMGRERNDTLARAGSRFGLGYPVRAIRKGEMFYLHNFEPSRWPSGDPELDLGDSDNGPTKKAVEERGIESANWQLCFGMRPADELYNLANDSECVVNLAANPEHQEQVKALRKQLFDQLKEQKDPRMFGQGGKFDQYLSGKSKDWKDKKIPKNPKED